MLAVSLNGQSETALQRRFPPVVGQKSHQPALHQAQLALGKAPISLIWGRRLKLSESGTCIWMLDSAQASQSTNWWHQNPLPPYCLHGGWDATHEIYLSALDDHHVPCPTPSAILYLVPLEALVDHWKQPIKRRVLCSLNPNYTPGNLSQCAFPIELRLSDIMQLFIM